MSNPRFQKVSPRSAEVARESKTHSVPGDGGSSQGPLPNDTDPGWQGLPGGSQSQTDKTGTPKVRDRAQSEGV